MSDDLDPIAWLRREAEQLGAEADWREFLARLEAAANEDPKILLLLNECAPVIRISLERQRELAAENERLRAENERLCAGAAAQQRERTPLTPHDERALRRWESEHP